MEVTSTSKSAKILTWITGVLSTVAGICWAAITYVFPDPTILGLGVLNWKNFLSFFAAFVFMGAMLIAIMTWRLPTLLRRMVNLVLAAGLCAIFFVIGMEYAKPSFEFAQKQNQAIENDSPTLMGKRIEMVDNVRVNLLDCRVAAQIPSCAFEFTSTNRDREISFYSQTSLFEPNGNALRIDRIVVGNVSGNHSANIDLVRNLATRITVIFEPTREQIATIPSVKLMLSGMENSMQVIKFNDVAATN
jgi:hypothetical protein